MFRLLLDNLPTHIYHTTTVSTIYTLKSLNTLVALIDLFKNGLINPMMLPLPLYLNVCRKS